MKPKFTTLAQDRALLAQVGIHIPESFKSYSTDAAPYSLQAQLQTAVNGAIPAFLANILDPKVIEVLFKPMNATEIFPERGLGNWTDLTAQFAVGERTGFVSSYGDYDNNGVMGMNYNWEAREQYVYQGICAWGDRELEMMAKAKINLADDIRASKVLSFAKFQNSSYFFGVANLQLYGFLNDPGLYPAITPTTKAAGGTSWSKAKPEEIMQDITNTFAQLVYQTGELVKSDDELVLAMSGLSASYMNNTNQFGLSVKDKLKEIYPKLKVVTAPEYATATGQLMQLIAPKVGPNETCVLQFGDKMRAFPVFRERSSFSQKFAAGTWGAILKFPPGIAQSLGI